jgi:hypothetical protein
MTFYELFISGKAKESEIFDHINRWHESGYNLGLTEYLGLTFEDHMSFVEEEESFFAKMRQKRASYSRTKFKVL